MSGESIKHRMYQRIVDLRDQFLEAETKCFRRSTKQSLRINIQMYEAFGFHRTKPLPFDYNLKKEE